MFRLVGRRGVGFLGVLCVLAGASPAAASAAPTWQPLPAPPTLDSIATGGGHTYVASLSGGAVRVDELTSAGWQQVGGLVRHDPTKEARQLQLAVAGDGHPWVVWLEDDASGIARIRVARYANGRWVEVAAAANATAPNLVAYPHLGFAAGRPFVGWFKKPEGAYVQIDFARLSDSGVWQSVLETSGTDFAMVTSGSRVYVNVSPGGGYQGIVLSRTTDDGKELERYGQVIDGGSLVALAGVAGRLGLLYYDADGKEHAGRLDAAGNLTDLGSSTLPFRAASLADVGGVPYLASAGDGGQLEVARLSGQMWEQLPAVADDARSDAPIGLLPVDGAPWVFYGGGIGDAPELRLAAFGEAAPVLPAPTETGSCGLIRRGGPGVDHLTGTSAGEELFGGGGDDQLFGLAGNDCLHGDDGADVIYGGKGSDLIYGGKGPDDIHGGKGLDRIFGGRGADRIYPGRGLDGVDAGRGDDTVFAADGQKDHINCGPGRDVLYTSGGDYSRNCERIVHGPAPAG